MKLSQYFPIKDTALKYQTCEDFPTTSKVGIEIELEGIPYINAFSSLVYWTKDKDDSLRDYGREFKTIDGLFGIDLNNALDEMRFHIKEYEKKFNSINVSERCSVHIHLGMENTTIEELINFMTLCYIFEKPLFNYGGINRRDLAYCIPYSELSKGLDKLNVLINNKENKFIDFGSLLTSKYAYVNTGSLNQHGTVEVRNLQGTKDIQVIKNWIKILLKMKHYSSKVNDISSLPKRISSEGFDNFTVEVFEEVAPLMMYPGFNMDVLSGIRNMQFALTHPENEVKLYSTFTKVQNRPYSLFRFRKRVQAEREKNNVPPINEDEMFVNIPPPPPLDIQMLHPDVDLAEAGIHGLDADMIEIDGVDMNEIDMDGGA